MFDSEERGFKITANVFGNCTRAEVIYNARSENSIISASLRPFYPVTVKQMMDTMLSSTLQADLSLSVWDITLNMAAMGIYIEKKDETNTYGLDRFGVQLGTTSKLDMQGSPKTYGFKLVDLMVSYRRGKALDSFVLLPNSHDHTSLVLTDSDKKKVKRDEFSHLIKSITNATQNGVIQNWDNNEVYPEKLLLLLLA
ncbi:hypothetical protein K7432_013362 [Basidiobolus ranarum]|uniref:Uncharacterized protein n=1 Tax=Basidiobolus ranarum TaxID=34480 RepID=A0ABR2WJI0_9FUNG